MSSNADLDISTLSRCVRQHCPNSNRNTDISVHGFCLYHACPMCGHEKSSNAQYCDTCISTSKSAEASKFRVYDQSPHLSVPATRDASTALDRIQQLRDRSTPNQIGSESSTQIGSESSKQIGSGSSTRVGQLPSQSQSRKPDTVTNAYEAVVDAMKTASEAHGVDQPVSTKTAFPSAAAAAATIPVNIPSPAATSALSRRYVAEIESSRRSPQPATATSGRYASIDPFHRVPLAPQEPSSAARTNGSSSPAGATESTIKALQTTNADLESMLANSKRKVEELERQVQHISAIDAAVLELRSRLAEAEGRAMASDARAEKAEALVRASEARLREEVNTARDVDALRLKTAEEELSRLRGGNTAQSTTVVRLGAEMENMRAELDSTRAQLRRAMDTESALTAQAAAATKVAKEADSRRAEALHELEAADANLTAVRADLQRTKNELESLRSEALSGVNAVSDEAHRAAAQVQALRAELAAEQAKTIELRGQVQDLKNQILDHESNYYNALAAKEAALKQLRSSQSREESDALRSVSLKLEAVQAELDTTRRTASDSTKAYKDILLREEAAQAKIAELSSALEASRRATVAASPVRADSLTRTPNDQLERLAASNEELRHELEETQAKLQEALSALQSGPMDDDATSVGDGSRPGPWRQSPTPNDLVSPSRRNVTFALSLGRPGSPAPSTASTMMDLGGDLASGVTVTNAGVTIPAALLKRLAYTTGRVEKFLRDVLQRTVPDEITAWMAASCGPDACRLPLGVLPAARIVRSDDVYLRNSPGWGTTIFPRRWCPRKLVFFSGAVPALYFIDGDRPTSRASACVLGRSVQCRIVRQGVDGYKFVISLQSPLVPTQLINQWVDDQGRYFVAFRTHADLTSWVKIIQWASNRPPPGLPANLATAFKAVRVP